MSNLDAFLRSGRVLLMDGAMGTQLQRSASHEPECFELWNLTQPERVRVVHQGYVAAGAQVLLTNTFQANPLHLAKFAAADRLEDIFRAAIAHALATTAGRDLALRLVLADMGPVDNLDAATASRLIQAAWGADGVLLETWSEPQTIRFFSDAIASQPAPLLPLWVSFAYWRKERELSTLAGYSPEDCARTATEVGAAGLGVNCGRELATSDYLEIVQRYRTVTALPIFARPNAGTPVRTLEGWSYPESPGSMAARLPELFQAGVSMIGGCCGTTPAHIQAFWDVIWDWNWRRQT